VSAKTLTREIQKGYLKLLILLLLSKKQMYGYEIMKEISERTMDVWRPTAGGVYPILRRMKEAGEVVSVRRRVSGRYRRVYKITPEGVEKLKRRLEKQEALAQAIEKLHREFLAQVLEIKPPPKPPFFLFLRSMLSYDKKKLTRKEKKAMLTSLKRQIEKVIEEMKVMVRNIESELSKLESSVKTRQRNS